MRCEFCEAGLERNVVEVQPRCRLSAWFIAVFLESKKYIYVPEYIE